MRLLITTQAVDLDDPVLGFFHEWIRKIALSVSEVFVICLREGKHELPPNVRVYSLGKEGGESRFKYLWRFFAYTWKLRNSIDVVFSHMNPHYIVLAGTFWKLRGVRMFLWRNHREMNIKTWIAAQFSTNVFYTSSFACLRRFTHSVQMPVGINTEIFHEDKSVTPKTRSVLFLGRLSRIKRPELFMKAVRSLRDVVVSVYGDATPDLGLSTEELRGIGGPAVTCYGSVRNQETPALYRSHELYVNLTPEGSMDKTVLEAAACGSLVLVYNKSYKGIVPDECLLPNDNPETITRRMEWLLSLSLEEKNRLRERLKEVTKRNHSLSVLVSRLMTYFTGLPKNIK